jgi:hypothetical protein
MYLDTVHSIISFDTNNNLIAIQTIIYLDTDNNLDTNNIINLNTNHFVIIYKFYK